jgi:hypothetical protein
MLFTTCHDDQKKGDEISGTAVTPKEDENWV